MHILFSIFRRLLPLVRSILHVINRVLDLVLDDVERILRGGHPLIAVPKCPGSSKP
uniref:Uncharacterized protein n=1 Tax=Arundo donax TaxID=35708 RepID=A0A0A9GQ57_ARUDO